VTEPRIEETGHGSWKLAGDLSFSTVPDLMKEMDIRSADRNRISIDLAGVTRSDSAGLALLIEWLRESERLGKSITFLNMPTQMQSIARICGLGEILQVDATTSTLPTSESPAAKGQPARRTSPRSRKRKARR
jgi:phospholipid transport system transporter-binding protein